MATKSGKNRTTPKRSAARVSTKRAVKQVVKKPMPVQPTLTSATSKSIPSVWQLARQTVDLIWSERLLLLGIVAVYGLLNLIFVHGFTTNANVGVLHGALNQILHGHFASAASSVTVLVVLFGSAGSGSSDVSGVYQLFLVVMVSLAVIWALRQIMAGTVFRIRDAYYKGMYPLIPFLLVLLVMGLQLVPLIIGSSIYATVMTNGIAVAAIEKIIWAIVFIALAILSLYWLSASVFGLYIVTLPNMTPLLALKRGRELVRKRRLVVARKLLFLPIALAVITGVIMVPVIIWVTVLAQWVFFALSVLAIGVVHTYLYGLYRELLDE